MVLIRALGPRRPVGTAVTRHDLVLAPGPPDVTGHLWIPPGAPAPAIVLAAGVTPRGPDDPRVVRLADALTRSGRVVFVPAMELPRQRIADADVERLVRAVLALHANPAVRGGVTLLGFSFGGSFALLAAADPRLRDRVNLVATFGAYGDLAGLIQAATTGVSTVGGHARPWSGHERAAAVLKARLDGTISAYLGGASPDHHAALRALLDNDDPDAVADLIACLPAPFPALVERLSPVRVAGHVHAPIILAHAVDDPTIPPAELARLQQAFPDARTHQVRLFTHVDFAPTLRQLRQAIADLRESWRFAATVLAAGDAADGVRSTGA